MADGGGELLTLGVLFLIAYVLGRLGKRIGLPAIPVYMIVGLLASPYSRFFPLSFAAADVELVATFGLILLLFNLGLEFDQEAFLENAGRLVLAGVIRIGANMAAGLALGFWMGWGTREALIIAGMTATSSSAIITKLLIELRRLANPETPMILGIAVLEDIFVAVYLAIVSVVLSGETDPGPIALRLAISFGFMVAMFAVARWGGRVVSRLVQTRDDELFTILFFGLAVAFGGIGELIGVSDAIGAFLIGLVLGATRFRERIESIALPLRDVFAAFFFLNFGLALNVADFGGVLLPVGVAVLMTLIINTASGMVIGRLNRLTPAQSVNASMILQNRGEFALILATLAIAAGLDSRLTAFAGLYVLSMAIIGPVLTLNSERIGHAVLGRPRRAAIREDAGRELELALAEAVMSGQAPSVPPDEEPDLLDEPALVDDDERSHQMTDAEALRRVQQAMQQSDSDDVQSDAVTSDGVHLDSRPRGAARERDPEY
ncbi:MAG: cation:proton antiporter [Micrococcales bacterium]|nr:cation:proton antiporter [Micrococcales bacterium]